VKYELLKTIEVIKSLGEKTIVFSLAVSMIDLGIKYFDKDLIVALALIFLGVLLFAAFIYLLELQLKEKVKVDILEGLRTR